MVTIDVSVYNDSYIFINLGTLNGVGMELSVYATIIAGCLPTLLLICIVVVVLVCLRKRKKNPEKQKSCPMTEMSEEKHYDNEYEKLR